MSLLCHTIWSSRRLGRRTTHQRPAQRAPQLFADSVRQLSVQRRRTMTWIQKTLQRRRKRTNYLHSTPPPIAIPTSRTSVGAVAVGHLRIDAKEERGARALARPRGDRTVVEAGHDLVQYLAAGLGDGTMMMIGAQEVAASAPAHIGQEVGALAAPLRPVLGRAASVEQVDTVRVRVAFRPAEGNGHTAMGGAAASRPRNRMNRWSVRFQRTRRLTLEKTC